MIGIDPAKGYWLEDEFPDLGDQIRPPRGTQKRAENQGADLVEYRAAMGAAMLIDEFSKLCDEALKVGNMSIPDSARARKMVSGVVAVFVTGTLKPFLKTRDYLKDTLTSKPSEDVDNAVNAVYRQIKVAISAYRAVMKKDPPPALGEELEATLALAANRQAMLDLVQPLSVAVGSKTGTAEDLAQEMMTKRSEFMGIAANYTQQTGVWKVGDYHIQELKSRTANVESRANIVTRAEFNKAYEAWLNLQNSQQSQKKT
jgi:hypothetical protein